MLYSNGSTMRRAFTHTVTKDAVSSKLDTLITTYMPINTGLNTVGMIAMIGMQMSHRTLDISSTTIRIAGTQTKGADRKPYTTHGCNNKAQTKTGATTQQAHILTPGHTNKVAQFNYILDKVVVNILDKVVVNYIQDKVDNSDIRDQLAEKDNWLHNYRTSSAHTQALARKINSYMH